MKTTKIIINLPEDSLLNIAQNVSSSKRKPSQDEARSLITFFIYRQLADIALKIKTLSKKEVKK